jgi:hypothetical protein
VRDLDRRAAVLVVATAALLLSQAALASGPLTAQFQVNTVTGSAQQLPAVAADVAGNFVVVWESYSSGGNDSSSRSIQARLFDAAGAAVGPEFQVNTSTVNEQKSPAVARSSNGAFVVVWESNHGTSDFDIMAQRYDAAGAKVGAELLVNSGHTTGTQGAPAVAMAGNGDFVVVWTGLGGVGGDPGISKHRAVQCCGFVCLSVKPQAWGYFFFHRVMFSVNLKNDPYRE